MTGSPDTAGAAPVGVIGLMSGTSLDGIDAAYLETDGDAIVKPGAALTLPYDDVTRASLRRALDGEAIEAAERAMTDAHARAVIALMAEAGLASADVDLIGFHGHTVAHRPDEGFTRQIGDGARLAVACGIDVIDDFRSADMAAGGQGAPLAALYHRALARDLERPVAVLNIGGVANLTWLGTDNAVLAFDTGPGGALLDDWVCAATGAAFDKNGTLAAEGQVDEARLAGLLAEPYFDRPPPKSLDRFGFDVSGLDGLSAEDGAATLVAFTARSVARGLAHLPATPVRWLVCGGGRHNRSIMTALAVALAGAAVAPVETVGWDGDALEAQAFAYLAVRSRRGMPLSLPETTGASQEVTGGRLHRQVDRSNG